MTTQQTIRVGAVALAATIAATAFGEFEPLDGGSRPFEYQPIDVAETRTADIVSYLAQDPQADGDEDGAPAMGMLQDDDGKAPGSWSGQLGVALSASDGASEKVDLRIFAGAAREGEMDETRLSAEYYLATSFGDKTENKFLAEAFQKWYLEQSKRWSFFLKGTYQYDDLQAFEQRVQGFAGIGYKFIDRENLWLEGRVGGGFTWDRKPDDDFNGAILLELEGVWDINDRTKLAGIVSFTPVIDDWSDNITVGRVELSTKMSDNLALVIGARDEYTSRPSGSPNNDLKVWAGVTYDF